LVSNASKSPAVFLDRDGTLIQEKNYLRRIADLKFIKGAIEAVKLLRTKGFKIFIITNQSGIARGYFSEKKLLQIHDSLEKKLIQKGAWVDGIYYCPHGPDDNCSCRKPKTAMVKRAQKEHKINLKKSYVIGDHPADFILAKNMGGKGVLVLSGHGKHELKNTLSKKGVQKPDKTTKNILSAAKWIVRDCTTVLLLLIFSAISLFAIEVSTQSYTIKYGDTLAKIAHKFYAQGKLYPIIANANNISNPHKIDAGNTLYIPLAPVKDVVNESNKPSLEGGDNVQMPATSENSQIVQEITNLKPVVPEFIWRTEENKTFSRNEKLKFSVNWKFINVGSAKMEVRGVDEVEGRKAYHIYTEANTAPFFDTFFKVRDTNESWIDIQSLCTLKFASHISEGNYKKNETIIYDQPNKKFSCIEEPNKAGDIPLWVQDVLSALYYLRTKELEVGKSYSIDAHTGNSAWPLTVEVVKKEKVKVTAGEFECFVVIPAVREDAGIFQAKGKLWVWLTADTRKIPVLLRSKIAIGSIDAILEKYSN